jgi:hypothetical protein
MMAITTILNALNDNGLDHIVFLVIGVLGMGVEL